MPLWMLVGKNKCQLFDYYFNFTAQIPFRHNDKESMTGIINIKYKVIQPVFLVILLLLAGCEAMTNENFQKINSLPVIEPDYINVTIPPNIAPLNFIVRENGRRFFVVAESEKGDYKIKIRSGNGKICFPMKKWRKLTRNSMGGRITVRIFLSGEQDKITKEYQPFSFYVAPEPVDSYLAYRLIYPGYYCWSNLRIVQRCVENFSEKSIIENQVLDMNCINCHSFCNNRPDRFMVHVRGSKGGTYVVSDGKIERKDLKIDPMPGSATYPSWHPSGKYIAFSSNQVRQTFYANPSKSIEVFDLVSDLIIYNMEKNSITMVRDDDTTKYLETFPCWSDDGRYLYFCRAPQNVEEPWRDPEKMELIKYSLVRVPFNPETGVYGKTEMVYDAAAEGKSVSFPRVSPDGNFIVFTLAAHGTFPIWHREADLYILNLQTGELKKMDINSEETESWHEWSSNGRWLVFSSKRLDGRSSRPFYVYFDSRGNTGKPFVLPQKDPERYITMLESFNLPQPVNGKIKVDPRDFVVSSKSQSVRAIAENLADSLPEWKKERAEMKRNPGERPIHE